MILERIGPKRFLLVDPRVIDWIGNRIPDCKPPGWAQSLGVVLDGKIVAGMAILYHFPSDRNCEVAFAADSPRWATRDTIRRLMHWPFVQLDCQRITTVIAASNKRAIKLNEGLGFKVEGVMRKGRGDDDAVILGLLRDEAPAWMLAPTPKLG